MRNPPQSLDRLIEDREPIGKYERMEWMVDQMAKAEGVDESMKVTDQMEWLRKMNRFKHRAEESILQELICS